ncbi:hypothetical protein K9857_20890 [Pseudomonas sp. REP124]|uniref:hypothetical protein n=1 Tax=Pseudomonas sp. REP124 TaxID=2875731 RepID=UPI001CCCBFDD|nr:hypothetical protein [Pseudomonas sp. REP124]MBZ9783995.1 hypothetical protein [Pseudomonas sp. REP124]
MSTDQKRSFIARIRCDDTPMKFFGQMLGNNATQANLLTTAHRYSEIGKSMVRVHKINKAVGLTRSDEMIVYFCCYDDYYNIQIRSEAYLGKYLSKNPHGLLGAFVGAGGSTTSFNLLNMDQDIITLDDLKKDEARVYLKARNADTVKRHLIESPKVYAYTDHVGDPVTFNLKILERDVPYPTGSTPYPLFIDPREQLDGI